MDCAQDDEDKEEEGEQGPGEQAMAVAEQPAVAGPGKKAKKGHPLVAAAVQVYISHIYTVLGFRVIAPLAKIIIIFKVKQK